MLRRTRIGKNLDVGRFGAAISRPGIDTRVWVSLAVALDESNVDSKYGVFVDVQLVPSGEQYTARVPADYAGKGFGFYGRIHKDDDLVVAIPSGDPMDGPVVVARLWSEADTPPQQAIDDPDEVMLIVEKDRNLRLAVSGEGKVEIDADKTVTVKCSDIRLGDLEPQDYAALAQKVLDELNNVKTDFTNMKTILATHAHPTAAPGPPSAPTPPGDLSTFFPHTPQSVACETTKVK